MLITAVVCYADYMLWALMADTSTNFSCFNSCLAKIFWLFISDSGKLNYYNYKLNFTPQPGSKRVMNIYINMIPNEIRNNCSKLRVLGWGYSSMTKHLFCMCEALGLVYSHSHSHSHTSIPPKPNEIRKLCYLDNFLKILLYSS